MLSLVLSRSWVASPPGPLGWDLSADRSPHQHQAAAERKNQWESLMLKNANKRKLKFNFKAARHLRELFFIVPAVVSTAGNYGHGDLLLLPPTPPKIPPLVLTGSEHTYSFTLSGQ